MISIVHLLWIVPLAGSLGGLGMALIIGAAQAEERGRKK